MTRTLVVGASRPTGSASSTTLVAAARRPPAAPPCAPARTSATVDAAARDVIATPGYGEQFPHGLGHGVGLEIHEAPLHRVDAATGTLDGRMPVTVEPGVYLPGRGGVRIEDTLWSSRDGGPELLTTTTKELLVV